MPLSRRQFNLVVLLVILGLIVGFYVFNLFFNRGTLQVSGQVPFTFRIDNGDTVTCATSPCEMTLMKGRYALTGMKDGYKDEEVRFVIDRAQNTQIGFNFEFIPEIRLKGNRVKIRVNDADYSLKDTPLTLEDTFTIRPLPDRFSDFKLSKNLGYAFFHAQDTEEEQNYFLDLSARSLKRLNLGDVEVYTYAENTLYFLKREEKGDKETQVLSKFTPGSITPLANFVKPLKESRVFVSQDENFVLVYDEFEGELFLVNTLEESREKLFEMRMVKDVKFSPLNSKMLVGTEMPGEQELLIYSMYDMHTKELKKDLSIVAQASTLRFRDESNIIYGVHKEYSPFGDALNNLLEGKTNTGLQVSLGRESMLVNYNLGFDKYTRIYEPESVINRVDIVDANTVLLGDAENVWEVKFAE